MKKAFISLSLGALLVAGLFVAVGCDQVIPPIRIPFSLSTGETGPQSFTVEAGGAIDGAMAYEGPVELPTENELKDMIREVSGDFLGDLINMDAVQAEEVSVTATEGDFSWATSIEAWFTPKPVNGVEQDPILLASDVRPGGFGSQFTLVPEPVDLLQLIRDNESNPAPGNPTVNIVVSGTVPENTVTFQVNATFLIWLVVG